MGFLWVESSILLDVIISLIPFLVKLLPPKKHLTMTSQPIPRSAVLVLILPQIPIHLYLRKKYFFGTGSLGFRESVAICYSAYPWCRKPSRLMTKVLSGSKCQYLVQNLLQDIYNNDMHPYPVSELINLYVCI